MMIEHRVSKTCCGIIRALDETSSGIIQQTLTIPASVIFPLYLEADLVRTSQALYIYNARFTCAFLRPNFITTEDVVTLPG
jgi:hypothetical protein